ncbi:hypothetical protein [Streptomyces sp. NP160]|uniref:hypothetical protein n=1 Tax=Streptomyces sp. NP160 TaxID=2586637 RepID=UPI0015D5E08B|nr:hypothetical protein [Streptomyces sp. NP160]
MSTPTAGGSPSREDLAIPDFDHLPVGSLQGRVRTLDAEQLDQLLRFEQAHGKRTAVLQVLRSRAQQLAAGAAPTGGDPAAPAPEAAPPADAGSPVDPTTAGEAAPAARHGLAADPSGPRGGRDS